MLGCKGGDGLRGPQTSPHISSLLSDPALSLLLLLPFQVAPSQPLSLLSLCLEFLLHLLPLSKPFPVPQGPALEPPPPGSPPDTPTTIPSILSLPCSLCSGPHIVLEISAPHFMPTQVPSGSGGLGAGYLGSGWALTFLLFCGALQWAGTEAALTPGWDVEQGSWGHRPEMGQARMGESR